MQTLGLQFLARADLGAKRGNDDRVAGLQAFHFILRRLGGDDLDAHVLNLVVHLGVVDDFAEQINGRVRRVFGKIFPRGIGQVNRALHAVAKSEFLRELHRQAVGGQHAAVGADAFDQFAAVMRQHLGLHGLHDVGAAEVDFVGSAVRFL